MRRSDSSPLPSRIMKKVKDGFRASFDGVTATKIAGDETKVFHYSYNLTKETEQEKKTLNPPEYARTTNGWWKSPVKKTSIHKDKKTQQQSCVGGHETENSVQDSRTRMERCARNGERYSQKDRVNLSKLAKTGSDSSDVNINGPLSILSTNNSGNETAENKRNVEKVNSSMYKPYFDSSFQTGFNNESENRRDNSEYNDKSLIVTGRAALPATRRIGLCERDNNNFRKSRKKGVCDESDGSHYQRQFLRVLNKRF